MKTEIENIIYNYANEIPHIFIEGVSKLIHPLFVLPLPCLRHNSLFTAAMLLIPYKMIYWALNNLYKLV